jgi:hypothetical protein
LRELNPYAGKVLAALTRISGAGVDKLPTVHQRGKRWGSTAEAHNVEANKGVSSCKQSFSSIKLLVLCELDPVERLKSDGHLIKILRN